MKLSITMASSLLACWLCAGLAAAAVTVDRPSPPPCCVDGLCYPKTNTWGYYAGRWRRWPGEELEPTPSALEPTPAERVGPEIRPFEILPPEQEDLRAPPPTKKPTERPPGPPAVPPTTTPPTEAPDGTGTEVPEFPWEEAAPSSDVDPPPTLPFGTGDVSRRSARPSTNRPAVAKLHSPGNVRHSSAGSDSPPPLPLALDRAAR